MRNGMQLSRNVPYSILNEEIIGARILFCAINILSWDAALSSFPVNVRRKYKT